MSSSVSSWTGSTLEDWLKLLAGDATRYWQIHVRYYWACWVFGTDPRKTESEQKRFFETCWCIPTDTGTKIQLMKLVHNEAGTSSHSLTLHGPIYMSVASLRWWNLFARPLWLPVLQRSLWLYDIEDGNQIVLFLFMNTARLLCQKLYFIYYTITNYYHSQLLRPAPQCLAFSSL